MEFIELVLLEAKRHMTVQLGNCLMGWTRYPCYSLNKCHFIEMISTKQSIYASKLLSWFCPSTVELCDFVPWVPEPH